MPKIPSLPSASALAADDQVPIEDVSAGTTKKALLSDIRAWLGIESGWLPSALVPTYSAASGILGTMLIPENMTDRITVGTRIGIVQGGVTKYFVVVKDPTYSSPNTTVIMTGGTDYALANAAISSFRYSHAPEPVGYPGWFNYTPTYSATSPMTYTGVTTTVGKFSVMGRRVATLNDFTGTTGGSASASIVFTAPVDRAGTESYTLAGGGFAVDGTDFPGATSLWVGTSQSQAFVEKPGAGSWTVASGRRAMIQLDYAI